MTKRPGAGVAWVVALVACLASGTAVAMAGSVTALALAMALVAAVTFLSLALALGRDGILATIFAGALLPLAWNAVRLADWMTLSDGLMLAWALLLLLTGRRPRAEMLQRCRPIGAGIALMSVAGLIGTYAATDVVTALANELRFVVAAAVPIVIAWWGPSASRIRFATWAWVVGAAISALVALLQLRAGTYPRPTGLTTQFNTLAITSLMAAGPSLALLSSTRTPLRLAAGLIAVLLSAAIVISGSRAGLLGYVAVLVVFIIFDRRPSASVGLSVVLATGGLVFAGMLTLPSNNAFARLLGVDPASILGSDAARVQALQYNVQIALDHPLTGIGYQLAGDAHNIFLQVLVSAGVVGLSGFLLILWAFVTPTLRYLHATATEAPTYERALITGLLASFVGFIVAGQFQNALWDRYIWVVPGLLLALLPESTSTEARSVLQRVSTRSRSPTATAFEHGVH